MAGSKKKTTENAGKQVTAYIAALPPSARKAMKQIRATIRIAAPDAVEGFGYGIPGFKLDGRVFLYSAAWKNHVSIYPFTKAMEREFAPEAKRYETSGKGTIRFPLEKPLPVAFVKRIAKARLAEVRAAKKGVVPKTRRG
jgi:uncharacterized protein YdhG (YjbR/CyaY superfamily)